jgi:hypothetical protein
MQQQQQQQHPQQQQQQPQQRAQPQQQPQQRASPSDYLPSSGEFKFDVVSAVEVISRSSRALPLSIPVNAVPPLLSATNPSPSVARPSSAPDLDSAAAGGTRDQGSGRGSRRANNTERRSRKRSRSGTSSLTITWSPELRAHVQTSQFFQKQPWKQVVAQAVAQGLLPSGPPGSNWEKTYANSVKSYYHNFLKAGISDAN